MEPQASDTAVGSSVQVAAPYRATLACVLLLVATLWTAWPGAARADDAPPSPAPADAVLGAASTASTVLEPRSEAWWTGPMLSPSAQGLPPGHILLEPYLFDVHSQGRDSVGSLVYALYGLSDRWTVGAMPIFSDVHTGGGPSRAAVKAGDLTLIAQYQLTEFHEGSRVPTSALVIEEVLPTGRYDRLQGRSNEGVGGGAYATIVGLYLQEYSWLPNGRILRSRLDLTRSFPTGGHVRDESVFGTPQGFAGHVSPRGATQVQSSLEYSLTQRWVLAVDLAYEDRGPSRIKGFAPNPATASKALAYEKTLAGSSQFAIAPAIEYNFNANVGVLLGVRFEPAGRNSPSSVTPALALNYVY